LFKGEKKDLVRKKSPVQNITHTGEKKDLELMGHPLKGTGGGGEKTIFSEKGHSNLDAEKTGRGKWEKLLGRGRGGRLEKDQSRDMFG